MRQLWIAVLGIGIFCGSGSQPRPYRFPTLPGFPVMPVPENNPVTYEGVALGRFLFYDPILSADSSFSCASCHKQEYAFSDAPNALSKGLDGTLTRRNTMPLFNLAWYPAYFWDGRAPTLEEQVFHPVRDRHEMNLQWAEAEQRLRRSRFYTAKFRAAFGNAPIDSNHIARAIGQFMRSMVSYRSKLDRVFRGRGYLDSTEFRGFELVNDMTRGNCLHCHSTDADLLGTTRTFSNNGLDAVYTDEGLGEVTGKPQDKGKFKIPSLRNLGFTAPYMHDGRFATLKEVLDFYSEGVHEGPTVDPKMEFAHGGGSHLTEEEKEQIIAFLMTLNDSAFVKEEAFTNPFARKRSR